MNYYIFNFKKFKSDLLSQIYHSLLCSPNGYAFGDIIHINTNKDILIIYPSSNITSNIKKSLQYFSDNGVEIIETNISNKINVLNYVKSRNDINFNKYLISVFNKFAPHLNLE